MIQSRKKIWVARLVNYTIMVALICGIGVMAYELRPPEVIYINEDFTWRNVPTEFDLGKWNVLLDVHCHTTGSDGVLTPEQSILWHIAQGFNAMVVTDHNTWAKGEETRNIARTKYNDSMKVFIGMEWGTLIHMNLILPPNVTNYAHIKGQTSTPTFAQIQAVITAVHDLGGIVIVNHVFDGPEISSQYPSRQQLFDWKVDYFEWYNGKDFDNTSATFSQNNEMGQIAGTDSHASDTTYAWNALNVTDFSETAIFDALKAGQTEILYEPLGLESHATGHPNPAYIPFKPLAAIGNLIESYYVWYMNFDLAGIAMLLGYIYGGFVIYYALGHAKTKIWAKIDARKMNKKAD
jgi:predicted metal-dependent phosphoesterase TrpH